MSEPPIPEEPDIRLPDPEFMGRSMADIAQRSQRLVNDWLKRQAKEGVALDPLNIGGAFLEMTAKLLANPESSSESLPPAGLDGGAETPDAADVRSLIDSAVFDRFKAMMPRKAVEEIYSAVAADLAGRLPALEAAMRGGDAAEVQRIAHAIKGGCGMVGLTSAQQSASRLETSNLPGTWSKELVQLQFSLDQLRSILGVGLPW